MNLEKILDEAIDKDASDVHLICDNKPMLRIARKLVPVQNSKVLTPNDMTELYDYLTTNQKYEWKGWCYKNGKKNNK